MIALLILAVAQNPLGDAILAAKQAYEQCMTATTLRLGATDSEPGDTVVAAARSECSPQFERFRAVVQIDDSALFVRAKADGEALAALLEARAKRWPSCR